MSKYSKKQLKQMAVNVMIAKEQSDSRYLELLMRMSLLTGLDVDNIKSRILRLATRH